MSEIINLHNKFISDREKSILKNKVMEAFQIIADSREWNQDNYDANVKELYKGVREKESFVFKSKIISPGKGIKNVKILMIETAGGNIEIKLMKQDHPDFFKKDLSEKIDQ